MIKRFLPCLLLFLSSMAVSATNIGEWTSYLSFREGTTCIPIGNRVFTVYGGNLACYHTESGETDFYSKVNGLNGSTITRMGYSNTLGCLVLVYGDNNIDLLYPDDDNVVNLPQLKQTATSVGKVNNLCVQGDEAVVCTESGVALLNLEQGEISAYYNLGASAVAAALFDGYIMVATPKGLSRGKLTDNLYDLSQWTTVGSFSNIYQMLPFAGYLYLTMADGVFYIAPVAEGTMHSPVRMTGYVIRKMVSASDSCAVFASEAAFCVVKADKPTKVALNGLQANNWTSVCHAGGERFWITNATEGLQLHEYADKLLHPAAEPVSGHGPLSDLCGYMRFEGDRLLVGGGNLVYNESQLFKPVAMSFEDGEWSFFQDKGVADSTGLGQYFNVLSMAQDPADPSHHFVSTGGFGLYEFRDYKYAGFHFLNNSPLRPFYHQRVRVDGLAYDKDGNLWMSNMQVDTVIHVLKPDGTWSSIYNLDIAGAAHLENFFFDKKGRLWGTSRTWMGNIRGGIFCFDYGGTIDNTADDRIVFRYDGLNEDGTQIDFSDAAFCAEIDHDGRIWFGSSAGVFVIDNPDEFLTNSFYFNQIKVPRNDGTNFADYLLSGVPVTAIAIDGANRKWLGTEGSGLFLVSANGETILKHFTFDNSPLPSDNILSLAVNQRNGEVFVGTDKGLISYQSEATEAAESLEKSNVLVYPNPVRPGYHGQITISGLTMQADVKIMTPAGRAVASGTSTGGTFVWNGRDFNGNPVAAGVYYVLIATADGKTGIAAKLTVVR